MKKHFYFSFLFLCLFVFKSHAQWKIYTVAGNGFQGSTGNGGQATNARFYLPTGVTFDPTYKTMYIADQQNAVIRQVNMTTGIITLFAGRVDTNNYSGDGGPATLATLDWPSSVCYYNGSIYIADQVNCAIRRVIISSGIISTVAGIGGYYGSSGDGGPATAAYLNIPTGVAFDGAGNMYIADAGNNKIREVNTAGIINTFAGSGTPGYTPDQTGLALLGLQSVEFNEPTSVAVDNNNNVFIADRLNNVIREISPGLLGLTYKVSTIAGNTIAGYSGDGGAASAAELDQPYGVTLDGLGNVFIADNQNMSIREITPGGIINTIAGNGNFGYNGDNIPATAASLYQPWAVAIGDSGNIYIPDNFNNRVRELIRKSNGPVLTATAYIDTICPGNSDTLTATSDTAATSFKWYANSVLVGANPKLIVNPTATTTYYVYGTTVSGTTIDSVKVVVRNIIVHSSTLDTVKCIGGPGDTLRATGGTTYTWLPSTGLNTTTGSVVVATPAATTTYTVSGVVAGCSTLSTKITVTVVPTPTLTISSTHDTICQGSTTTLVAKSNAGHYYWTPGIGLLCNTCDTTVAMPPPGPTKYYVFVSTPMGCSAEDSVLINVNPAPLLTPTPASATICKGGSIPLQAGPPGSYTYFWSPAASLSCTSCPNPIATPTVNTNYQVTKTNASGCAATATIPITVLPTSTVTLTASPASLCAGNSSTLTATGSSSAKYIWYPSTISSTSASVIVTPTITTIYSVMAYGGCSDTAIVTVNVTPSPSVIATSSSPSICAGTNDTLKATGATSYSWSPVGGLSCPTCGKTFATPSVTTTYYVTGITGSCSATDSITVIVNPAATVSVSATPTSICNGGKTTLTATGTGVTSYTWSPGISSTGSTVITTPTVTTTYSVMANGGCSNTATVKVIVTNLLIKTGIVNPITCFGNCNGVAAVSGSGGDSYVWSTGVTTSSISGLCAGVYTVTVDSSGCIGKDSVVLTQPSQINLTTTATNTNCSGSTGSASVTATGGTPGYVYLWSDGQTKSTANSLSAGTYTVTVKDKDSCSSFITVTISSLSNSLTVYSDDTTICSGGTATLNGSASGGISPYTYLWNSGITSATQIVSPTSSTTYTLTVKDKVGCTGITFDTVKVQTNVAQYSSSPSGNCAGALVILSDSLHGSGSYSYTWYQVTTTGNINIGSGTNINVHPPAGSSTYIVDACCGCGGITIADTLHINLGTGITACCDSTIVVGQSVKLLASPASYIYSWTPSAGLNCTSCPNPIATPTVNTVYYVTGIDSLTGCLSTDSVIITIGTGKLIFYNGITPNGDGHNDTWIIDNIELYPGNSVSIFNRWGIEVWSGDNYDNTTIVWKGFNKSGQPLPDATYFYVVKVDGATYKGWVQLTR